MPHLLEIKELSKSFTIHHLGKNMQAIRILLFTWKRVSLSALSGKVAAGNQPF